MAVWEADEQRFKELVLYISQKCADNPRFGAIKLNKILYYCDFLSYAMLGEPITGFEYQKLEKGPAPRGMARVREELERSGELVIRKVRYPSGVEQHRTVNLRAPDLKDFTEEQVALVDHIIEVFRESDAEWISEFSHAEVGWKAAEMLETIPYGTVLLSDAPLTEAEIRSAQQFAREYGYATEEA